MNIAVERLQARSIYWRCYAAIVVLSLLIMVQRRPLVPGAGLNFEGAQALYWSLAPIGLIGYAYGFRIGSQTFWRVYAMVFTADITVRAMAKVGWVPLARLFGFPEDSRHGTTIILLGLAFIAATCVALLRYGGWLKGQIEALPSGRSAPTASSPATVERQLPVSRPYQRYSLGLCALACLAGAAVNAVARHVVLGDLGLALTPVEALLAFATFAMGARGFANNLANDGKDTVVRGAAIGGMLGAIVAASVAVFFATALSGIKLLTNWAAILAAGLIGAPLGVVGGAATGVALILLGRWSRCAAAMTVRDPLPQEGQTVPAQDTRISSFASMIAPWAAIIFVFPAALFAAFLLVPQASELFDRILHHPAAPLLSLTVILALQVALVVLPALTFLSWRNDMAEAKPGRRRRFKTTTLAWVTIGVGLFAYVWIAGMVAAFPD